MGDAQLGEVDLLRAELRAGGLLGEGDARGGYPLVAMLSGGRDSVCLLDVAVALRGADAVRALHLNYGLRDAAEEDERYCLALCKRLGVELSVLRAGGPPAVGNLQAWARAQRYRAAEDLAATLDREGGRAVVATGHTASDQVETILYRLAASPGRRALSGMTPREGRVVRPLLTVTREQTASYCRARNLGWREDESNLDERFARARVRAKVVPALREVHPAAEANVLRTARLLREEGELLERVVDTELAGGASVALARLEEMPRALARMVLVRLAEEAVGGYVPQAGERVEELLELGARGGAAELHLGGSACAVLADGVLTIRRLAREETSMRGRGALREGEPRPENAPPSGD